MMDNVLAIAVMSARAALRGHENEEPEERFRLAAKEAKQFWLSTDDDLRFKSAVGAVLETARDDEERNKIARSIRIIGQLNALLSGCIPSDLTEFDDVIPFVRLWGES